MATLKPRLELNIKATQNGTLMQDLKRNPYARLKTEPSCTFQNGTIMHNPKRNPHAILKTEPSCKT